MQSAESFHLLLASGKLQSKQQDVGSSVCNTDLCRSVLHTDLACAPLSHTHPRLVTMFPLPSGSIPQTLNPRPGMYTIEKFRKCLRSKRSLGTKLCFNLAHL